MRLDLVPITRFRHERTRTIHQEMGLTPPPEEIPPRSIIIETTGSALAASCYLYPAGPFLLAEWLVTGPGLPAAVVHQAVELLVETGLTLAAAEGLTVLVGPRSRSIAEVCARYGFQPTGIQLWIATPSVQLNRQRPIERGPETPQVKPARRKR